MSRQFSIFFRIDEPVFTKVINKAMIACNNSGHDVIYDFVEVNKIVDAGATSKPVKDYELSRYACYQTPSDTPQTG